MGGSVMIDEESYKSLLGCIRYWESKLVGMSLFLSPSEEALIQLTIKFLTILKEQGPVHVSSEVHESRGVATNA